MKKRAILVISVLLLLSVLFSACSSSDVTEIEFYTQLDGDGATSTAGYATAIQALIDAPSYTYTVDLVFEEISNFDHDNRLMPKEKAVSEDKRWYEPQLTYTYVKDDGNEYVCAMLTDGAYELQPTKAATKAQQRLANGAKATDKLTETAAETEWVYVEKAPITVEVWTLNGAKSYRMNGTDYTLLQLETDAALAADFNSVLNAVLRYSNVGFGDIALAALQAQSNYDTIKNATFQAESSRIFGKDVNVIRTYEVLDLNGNLVGYRDSQYASGYDEDLKFDWENIRAVDELIVSSYVKKEQTVMVEILFERINTYNVTSTQVWNNETVVKWYGAKYNAGNAVIEIEYPTKKNPIDVPAN